MRDGTAKPVSRGQILKANGDREEFVFPIVQLTTRWIIITTIKYSFALDDDTYIPTTYCR